MPTTFETERGSTDDILDRSVAALRDAPVAPGPSPQVQTATLAALARGAATPGFFRGFGTSQPPARAAVLACLAAGAAALCVAVARHRHEYAGPQPPMPPAIASRIWPTDSPLVAAAGSMVTGEIRFEGQAPPPRLIDFGAAVSGAERHGPMFDDSLLVNRDDTLQNVVVSVVAGLPEGETYPEPDAPADLNQVGCAFSPHVLAMRTGQPIVVRNSDPVLHDVHSLSVRNKRFKIVQPGNSASEIPSLREPETFQVKCGIHPWMSAWFCAFDHPYFAVSLENGTFTLRGLPPGRYRLRAWHERLGTQECEMVVKPDRDETINFVFRLPSAPESPQAAGADSRITTIQL